LLEIKKKLMELNPRQLLFIERETRKIKNDSERSNEDQHYAATIHSTVEDEFETI